MGWLPYREIMLVLPELQKTPYHSFTQGSDKGLATSQLVLSNQPAPFVAVYKSTRADPVCLYLSFFLSFCLISSLFLLSGGETWDLEIPTRTQKTKKYASVILPFILSCILLELKMKLQREIIKKTKYRIDWLRFTSFPLKIFDRMSKYKIVQVHYPSSLTDSRISWLYL